MTSRLRQSDEQFGYEVVSRALDRSADANHYLDTLFFTLMAGQAAIYAIIVDRLKEHANVGWELLLGGFVVATAGTALTVFVREGPDPQDFVSDFPDDPSGTRRRYVDNYAADAKRNERLRITKGFALAVALLLTIGPLIIATASRPHGV